MAGERGPANGRLRQLAHHIRPVDAAAPSGGGQMTPRGDWDPSFAPAPLRQTSGRCLSGVAQRDVTPPPGIYNRNWGAAARDTSTGSHGSLRVSAIAFAPLDVAPPEPLVILTVDLGWLLAAETAELCEAVSATCGFGVDSGRLLVQMTHTHAGPSLTRPFTDGADCPGGEIALTWWEGLKAAAGGVVMDAIGSLEPAWLTSARGRCDLAQQQEYLDRGVNDFVSTFSEAPSPPTHYPHIAADTSF